MTLKQLQKRLETEKARAAALRDRLRVLSEDASELESDAGEAEDNLDDALRLLINAADMLSRNV